MIENYQILKIKRLHISSLPLIHNSLFNDCAHSSTKGIYPTQFNYEHLKIQIQVIQLNKHLKNNKDRMKKMFKYSFENKKNWKMG